MSRALSRIATVLFLAGAPTTADAHLVNTRLGDFYNGILHPLTGFEFILPWLALSILAAFQERQRGRWLLLVFPLALLLGAVSALFLPNLAVVPLLSIVIVACLGLLVAASVQLPLVVFLALIGIIGLLHGYETGREMSFDTDRVLFIGGVTAVGYAFVALTSGVAVQFLKGNTAWRFIALRAGGSWIAAVGIMVLGVQLAGAPHGG